MTKIAIIDDELHAQEAISHMIATYCTGARVSGIYSNVGSAVQALKDTPPDILLLDIQVGKESGFDVFSHFPNPSFKVIFLTAYQDYAVKAFRFSALDYLLKPIDPDLFQTAIIKAMNAIDQERMSGKINTFLHNISVAGNTLKRLVLKTASDIHIVEVNDIMYCEADHSYTTFYLSDKSRIVVSNNLGEYEDLLAESGFMRIHQSYLMNMQYLKRYEKGEGGKVVLKDNTSLPLSIRKRKNFSKS